MIKRLSDITGLDRAAIAQGLRLAFSAWIAFSLAALVQPGHAYWAAMPVWVVSQSARGLLVERAIFRTLGTLIGGAIGYGIAISNIGSIPELVALGIWIAINATFSPLLRGTFGYGALLSGMTAAIVVLPTIAQPQFAAGLALARVECTLIGVVVVTVVTSYWTPEAPRDAFFAQVRALARSALAFAIAPAGDDPRAEERRILKQMAAVQASATQIIAGSFEGYRRLHDVDALIHASLAIMAAGQSHFRRQGTPAPASGLEPHVALAEAALTDTRLARALSQFDAAEQRFNAETAPQPRRTFRRLETYFAPQSDVWLATENGLLVGAVTTLVAVAAVIADWALGELVAIGVCIFSMVLVTMPTPRAIAPIMLKGVGLGVVVAVLYRVMIGPHIATVSGLLASMAPFMLIGGLARASRRTAAPALDFNMCFMLASQPMVAPTASLATILSQSGALLLGVVLVTGSVLIIPVRTDRRAAQAARAIGRDLERLTDVSFTRDPVHAVSVLTRQTLRLGLHLEKAVHLPPQYGSGVLALFNLGDAIAALHRLSLGEGLPAEAKAEAYAALVDFSGLTRDPLGVAERVDARALISSPPVTQILRDAASAMRASRALLEYAATK